MKKKLFICVVLVGMVSVFCAAETAGSTGKIIPGSDVDSKIRIAKEYLLEDGGSEKDCNQGFLFLLEAIVSTLPQAGYPEEFKKKLITANNLFKKNGIFDSQGIQLLNDAYRSINAGKDFRMPNISGLDQTSEYGKNMMEKSRKNLKEGKTDLAVKLLLETAVMVVTPV